jgi:tetratricopeptide (TPR) repeat protein
MNMPGMNMHESSPEVGACPPLPTSVKLLGSLYLLVGALALIQTIWAAFQGTFYLGIEVIAIPLGVGLLRRSPAWRKLTLCAAVVQILAIGLVVYLLCRPGEDFADMSADLSDRIGSFLSKVVLGALAALLAAALVISLWSIYLLTRKKVKGVFQPDVTSRRRLGWLPPVALVLLLATTARETGGVSLHYFKWSEEDPREEKQEGPRVRIVLGDRAVGEGNNSRDLAGFEAPCLIEVRGMSGEWYRVVTTFNVQRRFSAGSGSTETDWEWKGYGGRAASQIAPALRDSPDRFVVEVDPPQLSGDYWVPLSKHFTVEYRARIHGEGKYESYQDEVNQRRDVTVSGLCSVRDLKQHLLTRTKDAACDKIMQRAKQAAEHATRLMSEGSKAMRVKEYDRAITIFNKAIHLDPKDAHAFRERGLAWMIGKAQFDKAIHDYDEAIRLDPKDALAFNNRGRAWYNKKEYDKAIHDYDEAIRLDPKSGGVDENGKMTDILALAFRNRAAAWSAKKDYERAIKDYDEAIRLDPKHIGAFNDRGLAWLDKKEYDKAIKDYDDAIRLDPKYAYAFNNRGVAWMNKKEYDKAIKDYDEAIRLEPKYTIAFYNRGLAWSLKKDSDKASKDYDKVSKDCDEAIREGSRSPYNVLVGHLAARQAGNEPAAKRLLEDSAGNLDETWPYPVVQFLRGDIDEMALLKLSTDDDKRTEARCVLGMEHAIKGRRGEALANFRWVKDHGNTAKIAYTIAVVELERLERPAERPKP